jgi:hypothetical protein
MQLCRSHWFQPSVETTLTVLDQLNERFVADFEEKREVNPPYLMMTTSKTTSLTPRIPLFM